MSGSHQWSGKERRGGLLEARWALWAGWSPGRVVMMNSSLSKMRWLWPSLFFFPCPLQKSIKSCSLSGLLPFFPSSSLFYQNTRQFASFSYRGSGLFLETPEKQLQSGTETDRGCFTRTCLSSFFLFLFCKVDLGFPGGFGGFYLSQAPHISCG